MNIWEVLGIKKCKDEGSIKKAYYDKLRVTNPEDHPEEFKLLRQAFEEATAYAKGSTGSSADLNEFMQKVDEIYQDYQRRIRVESWRELLEDYLTEEDTKKEASFGILKYIAQHSFVPHEVLSFLNECFDWLGRMEELSRAFPRNYLEFIIANVQYEDIFFYDKLPIMEDFDYDGFISKYFDFRKAYSKEDLEACLTIYQDLSKYPFDNLNVDMLAFCVFLYLKQDEKKAEELIAKWAKKEPEIYENLSNSLGYYYQSQGRFDEAVACYKNAILNCESQYENYVSLLRILRRLSRYDEALPVMLEAKEKFPKEADSLYQRIADLYFDMGEYEKAIAEYEALNEVAESKGEFFGDIGFCYEAMETADVKAEEYYKKGIEANSEDAECHRIYGMFLLEKKRVEEALLQLKEAYRLNPENSFVALCLGKASKEAGEENAAKAYFEISLSIAMNDLSEDEEDTCILESVADALVQLERFDEALDYANRALKNQYCMSACPGKGCLKLMSIWLRWQNNVEIRKRH